jgi:hypothetical protein
MIPKPIADVTLADIQTLATNGVAEGRTLEFKAELPGPRDKDKREFLHDVISFANTDGGDLIFGVEAKAGVAKGVPGAALVDSPDGTVLRLEGILGSCVEPRLIGVRTEVFDVTGGGAAILMRIPASFAAPHRGGFDGSYRFYHRNSRGKAEMDVHELRAAFAASEGLTPRLKALHEDAVRQAQSGDLPFHMAEGPRAVLSIMPLGILREPRQLDLDNTTAVYPVSQQQGLDWLRALEGFYVYGVSGSGTTRSYALTRRTGQVDVCWRAGRDAGEQGRLIWPQAVEQTINSVATGAAARLGAFGIEGPFAVALTLSGVLGYGLYRDFFAGANAHPAWRDRLSLPALVVDDLQPENLLPLAETFWLALGQKRPDGAIGSVT